MSHKICEYCKTKIKGDPVRKKHLPFCTENHLHKFEQAEHRQAIFECGPIGQFVIAEMAKGVDYSLDREDS
jgi:hypothetical protein